MFSQRGMLLLEILSILIAFLNICNGMPDSGMQELREEELDSRYKAKWQADFTKKSIDIWLEVQTNGYVGFGLSNSGSMAQADLLFAGVYENKTVYHWDYHGANENGQPIVDSSDDWEIIEVTETGDMTNVHVRRLLDTCDDEDLPITDGTIKILWAIGEKDDLAYHNETKGGISVNMLDPPAKEANLTGYDTYKITTTIEMTDKKETLYWCSMHKRDYTNKSHIIAFKPILETPEALKFVHHFNVYVCYLNPGETVEEMFEPHIEGPGHDCHEKVEKPIPRGNCYRNLYSWSFGGRIMVLPNDIGFPWGEDPTGTEYFMIEAHLNNPGRKENEVITTGVTLYHTEELREIEAGLVEIKYATNPGLTIPPSTKNWTLVGHCGSSCTGKTINDKITIFNVNLHAHQSARKLKFRHFRGDKELPWIASDDTYDFDYQENRPLANPVEVLPGDHLSIECTYDSNWKNGKAVVGGFGSEEEMCIVFAIYHPRVNLDYCISGTGADMIMNKFGITNATATPDSLDPTVVTPEKWAGKTYSDILNTEVNWTEQLKAELQEQLRYGLHYEVCGTPGANLKEKYQGLNGVIFDAKSGKAMRQDDQTPIITYPKVSEEYQIPDTCDAGPGTETTTPSSANSLSYLQIQSLLTITIISSFFLSKLN